MKNLTASDKKSYLFYAIGEIILVMIGILLAMQVNNWNEKRKHAKLEQHIYNSFIEVLTRDSIHLAQISDIFSKGLAAHKYFIEHNSETALQEKSLEQLETEILSTLSVSHSFFPRYGIYQEVLNNGEFALLKSKEIKNQLTEIYERSYSLYEHVDATVEHKIHNDLQPVVKGKYQLFLPEENIDNPYYFNEQVFRDEYENFILQLRNMNSILNSTMKIIGVMDKNISLALELLREEVA